MESWEDGEDPGSGEPGGNDNGIDDGEAGGAGDFDELDFGTWPGDWAGGAV